MPLQRHQKHALGFLLRHLAVGTVGGFVFGGLLLYFDVGNLWTMMRNSRDTGLWMFLLFFGLFITFGGIAMAWGVMGLGQERD
jgi:hypothetical protein